MHFVGTFASLSPAPACLFALSRLRGSQGGLCSRRRKHRSGPGSVARANNRAIAFLPAKANQAQANKNMQYFLFFTSLYCCFCNLPQQLSKPRTTDALEAFPFVTDTNDASARGFLSFLCVSFDHCRILVYRSRNQERSSRTQRFSLFYVLVFISSSCC